MRSRQSETREIVIEGGGTPSRDRVALTAVPAVDFAHVSWILHGIVIGAVASKALGGNAVELPSRVALRAA